jgi:cyanophycinase
MHPIFLHGGGDALEARDTTFGRFLSAVMARPGALALVVAEPDQDAAQASYVDYLEIFTDLGLPTDRATPLFVSPEAPLTAERFAELDPAGILVCGGETPRYQASLCVDLGWVDLLRQRAVPYGGTSACAAIAANQAIVGGWQAERAGSTREILFHGASEGLDALEVRPGLGLAPFAIDVHASQWGTLLRLVHAVELGFVAEGWAIDESTQIELLGAQLRVIGRGQAYHVVKNPEGSVGLTIHAG